MSQDWDHTLRQAFTELCGAVMVRNLRPRTALHTSARPQDHQSVGGLGTAPLNGKTNPQEQLLCCSCEVILEGRVLYRSGIVRNSSNPTWTVQEHAEPWVAADAVVRHALQEAESTGQHQETDGDELAGETTQPKGTPLSKGAFDRLKLVVYQEEETETAVQNQYPYHQRDPFSSSKAERRKLLEEDIILCTLERTGATTSELSKFEPQEENQVIFGLHCDTLPSEIKLKPLRRLNSSNSAHLYMWKVPRARENISKLEPKEALTAKDANSPNLVGLLNDQQEKDLLELVTRVRSATLRLAKAESAAKEKLAQQRSQAEALQREDEATARIELLRSRQAELEASRDVLRAENSLTRQKIEEGMRVLLQAGSRMVGRNNLGTSDTKSPTKIDVEAEEERQALVKAKQLLLTQECLIRAHRINIMRMLTSIYPLQERYSEAGKWEYMVRGIVLPDKLSSAAGSGALEEEQVSTALGYLAHFILLMSKYLNLHLRYLPLPHSSSSTICDPLAICAETPHEPLSRTLHASNTNSSYPRYIFGSASGRLGRSNARRALSLGTFPLYWRGITKRLQYRFDVALHMLTRDVQLVAFTHTANSGGSISAQQREQHSHIIAQLRNVLADY
mmetsp:Transcript_4296/g.8131  ORF Transcript_4296/g.8131 Transcript_4296/m.8131 type:complete len:621 (+) Transcript_4296:45-1907(+)